MNTEGILSTLRITFSGLSSQMKRLGVISENIANANRSPDENGNVYHKKVVEETFRSGKSSRRFGTQMAISLKRSNSKHLIKGSSISGSYLQNNGTTKNKIKIVETKGERLVHNPSHPRADKNGYVKMPNVNVVEEMVDMISTSRAYEANVNVIDAAKKMAKKALEI